MSLASASATFDNGTLTLVSIENGTEVVGGSLDEGDTPGVFHGLYVLEVSPTHYMYTLDAWGESRAVPASALVIGDVLPGRSISALNLQA